MSAHPPAFREHEFRKAERSYPDKDCVHVARRDGWVAMRDSKKTPFGAADDHCLLFTDEQFDAYQNGVRAGQFEGHVLTVTRRADMYVVSNASSELEIELVFTRSELAAFHDGIAKREFDVQAFA